MSYAIGVAAPLSVTVMDYGTSSKSNEELTKIVRDNFDLRPGERENMRVIEKSIRLSLFSTLSGKELKKTISTALKT